MLAAKHEPKAVMRVAGVTERSRGSHPWVTQRSAASCSAIFAKSGVKLVCAPRNQVRNTPSRRVCWKLNVVASGVWFMAQASFAGMSKRGLSAGRNSTSAIRGARVRPLRKACTSNPCAAMKAIASEKR